MRLSEVPSPPNIVEELKWKEGQELGAGIKENKLIVKKI